MPNTTIHTIRKAPYTFTVTLTDWGWKVSGKHDDRGDVSLLLEHELPISAQQSAALWDLVEENVYDRKADATKAVRDWLATTT